MKETHSFVQLARKNKYRIKRPLSFVHIEIMHFWDGTMSLEIIKVLKTILEI